MKDAPMTETFRLFLLKTEECMYISTSHIKDVNLRNGSKKRNGIDRKWICANGGFDVRTPLAWREYFSCATDLKWLKSRDMRRKWWQQECGGKKDEMGNMWLYQPQRSILAGYRIQPILSDLRSNMPWQEKDLQKTGTHKHREIQTVA